MQRSLQLSDRFFRKLIHVYSFEHRRQFGGEMAQVFRDLCLEVYRREGAMGLARLWLATLFDLAITGLAQRFGTLPLPSRADAVTIGSWSAVGGGVMTLGFALTHASPNWIDWVFRLEWMWPTIGALYLFALIGVAALPGSKIDMGLVVALVGAAIMAVSGTLMLFFNRIWISFGNGLLLLGGGLLLSGLLRMRDRGSPSLMLIFLPLGTVVLLLWLLTPEHYMGRLFRGDAALSAAIIGLGWIATGLVLMNRRKGTNLADEEV